MGHKAITMKHLFVFTKFLLLTGLVYLFALNFSYEALLTALDKHFFVAIFLYQIPLFITTILIALRFLYFVNDSRVDFGTAFVAVVLSTGFNYILPARMSEFIKATYIQQRSHIPVDTGLAAVFLERLCDLIVVALLSLCGLLLFTVHIDIYAIAVLVIVTTIVLIFVVMHMETLLSINKTFVRWEKARHFIERLFKHVHGRIHSKRFLYGLMQSLVIWTSSMITVGIYMNAAGTIPFDVVATATLIIGGAIGLAVPALPGGLGTYEAASVAVMMQFGYDFNTALALAVGMRIANMIIMLPLALWLAFKKGTGFAQILQKIRNKG